MIVANLNCDLPFNWFLFYILTRLGVISTVSGVVGELSASNERAGVNSPSVNLPNMLFSSKITKIVYVI